jgi:hypothetical protein
MIITLNPEKLVNSNVKFKSVDEYMGDIFHGQHLCALIDHM